VLKLKRFENPLDGNKMRETEIEVLLLKAFYKIQKQTGF